MNVKLAVLLIFFCIQSLVEAVPVALEDTSNCTKELLQGQPSYLWRITKPGSVPSYLFGTIHVPFVDVWPMIPTNVETALRNSDEAVFELDLSNFNVLQEMDQCRILPNNQTIDEVIPAELYEKLKLHFANVRREIENWMGEEQKKKASPRMMFELLSKNWQRTKPEWLRQILESLTKDSVKKAFSPVLDQFLLFFAKRMGKITSGIETVNEQCSALNGLSLEDDIYVLNFSLSLINRDSTTIGKEDPYDVEKSYKCLLLGDDLIEEAQKNIFLDATPQQLRITDYFKKNLLTKRNIVMAKRMDEKIENGNLNKTFFFAFGAGHFLGETSIQTELLKLGYNIERLNADYRPLSRARLIRQRREVVDEIDQDSDLFVRSFQSEIFYARKSIFTKKLDVLI